MKKRGIKLNRVKRNNENMKILNHSETMSINQLDDEIYKSIITNTKIDFTQTVIKDHPRKHVIERKKILKSFIKQLKELNKLPFFKQRTQEWFEARKNILTASNLEEAISKSSLRLAKTKAGVIVDNTVYSTIAPLKWGTMFEDMASRCYSQKRNDIRIFDFGLVIDNQQEHFGASPDGITEHGVMIEIKCPYSRKIIDGQIPHKYYLQIQGQLATCSLKECDYIECDFEQFNCTEKYLTEVPINSILDHGVIAEFKNVKTGEYSYVYSDPYLKSCETIQNVEKKKQEMEPDEDIVFIKMTPWKLKQMNVQKVLFDEVQWVNIVPKIQDFWKKVEDCKSLPVEEVKPKPKAKFITDD